MPDKFTFTAPDEIAQSVAPDVGFLALSESPLLAFLGFPGRLIKATNTRHDFEEESLLPNSTLINNPGGYPLGTETVLAVDAGTGTRFAVNDVVQVRGSRELMLVTIPAANQITVTRSYRGTTGVAIADDAEVQRLNNPPVENEAAPAANPVSRVLRSNYTEIFRKPISVTRSRRKVKNLTNIGDEFNHQRDIAEKDLLRDLALSVINGKRQAANPEGTALQPRTMDGIIQSILYGASADAVVVDAGGLALTETHIKQVLRETFQSGGKSNILAMAPTQKERLASLIEGRVRWTPEAKEAGIVVELFNSDYGQVRIIVDTFVPPDVILSLDSNRIRIATLGEQDLPFETIEIGKTGLTDQAELVGEFTLEMKNAQDGGHGLIQNLLQ